MFTNVADAIFWIENIERNNKENTLKRMALALDILDHPEESYKKIHITGTNGKGSTLNYIANILEQNGLKVGSFVSPYLVCFNERIQINGEYISDSDLLKYVNIVYDVTKEVLYRMDDIISFFEVITLIGFLYFKDMNIDIAVIEVGVGGKLDATNVINADVSIITNVGFDHMNTLGKTLEEITLNKLGILKENGYLITAIDDELFPLVTNYCIEKNAMYKRVRETTKYILTENETFFEYQDQEYRLKMIGQHQIKNAIIAIETIKYLFPSISFDTIKEGLYKAKWIGRLECMQNNPKVYIDGAHNTHGIAALSKSIKEIFRDKKVNLIFCALKDKETKSMIKLIENDVDSITITTINDPRVKDPNELYAEINIINKRIIFDYKNAIDQLILEKSNTNEIILISGSLHFISFVRKYLLSK